MSSPAHPRAAQQQGSVLISLGSNVEPEIRMPQALVELRAVGGLVAVSALYASAAAGPGDSGPAEGAPDFMNAAVRLLTRRPPRELKFEVLRPIEERLGRVRSQDKYAPRPIDLDLAFYENQVWHEPGLVIPDPEITARPYLAVPLAEVAAEWMHPTAERSLAEIAAHCGRNGLREVPWPQPAGRAAEPPPP